MRGERAERERERGDIYRERGTRDERERGMGERVERGMDER